jgi:alginate O-acetyltransferase complex protein AlgI
MLFNSYAFIFGYLPVTMAGFFLLARSSQRLAALWLAAASLFFYGWWNPAFVVLVMASITVNYAFGFAIGHIRSVNQQGKTVLTVSIAVNLGLLAYFKYANFFITNLSQLTGMELAVVTIVLPLGISFFTFTQIAFLVDVYRGIAREYSFIHYVLFVTYFPHLIAGPVLHHKQMMPQFGHAGTYRIDLENISIGLTIFIIGLAKKVLLADQFALYSNPVFDVVAQGGEPKLFEAWIAALAYTLQLYFDFSGYSDMAIGLSRMFNVKLPLNFDSPYKAPNIIEFWRRWHMTLSTFLREYLYVPLGGSRKGIPRRYANLMITMLLGGLWHGAGWTFVIWGGLHGVYLVINHGWRHLTGGTESAASNWRKALSIGLTFVAVVVAWVPFRSPDLDSTLRIWAGMFALNGILVPLQLEPFIPKALGETIEFGGVVQLASMALADIVFWIPLGLTIIWILPNTQEWMSAFSPAWDIVPRRAKFVWSAKKHQGLIVGFIFAWCLINFGRASEFLYFQF